MSFVISIGGNVKRYFACLYGGANERIDSHHMDKIEELGKLIAVNGFSLVYGAV